jgi:hypothetical protein
VDHAQVADAISKVAGRKIDYVEIKPEELKQGLLKAGLPEDYSNFLILIFGFLKEGYSERKTTSVKDILGREARSLSQYVTNNKQAWLK